MRGIVRVGMLIALLLSSAPASAQLGAADEAKRTKLFQEGKRLADEGRWSEAVVPLREVIALRSAPKALIALAVVERQLVHFLEARALLERAVTDAKAQGLADDEQAARVALEELSRVIPRVVLAGAAADPAASVFVDDLAPVRKDEALLLDPGAHVVRVEIPGRAPHRERVSLAPGQVLEIRLAANALGTAPAAPTAAPRPPDTDDGPSILGPIILGAGGVAVAGVGLALALLGNADQRDAEEQCGGTEGCSPDLRDLVDGGADKIIAGDVLLGVGGALAIGGVVWLAVELTSGDDAPATAVRPTPSGLQIVF